MTITPSTQFQTTTLGASGPMMSGATSITTSSICGSSRRIFGKKLRIENKTLCADSSCNHPKTQSVPCKRDCDICPNIRQETHIELKNVKRLCCENWSNELNCKSKQVIYLITCKDCNRCYVGQTKRQLRTRFLEHKRESLSWKIKGYSQHHQELYKHFALNNCDPANLTIQIICSMPGTWNQKVADEKEVFYIRLLNTAHPIGFNTDIRGYGFINQKVTQNMNKVQPYYNLKFVRKPRKRTRNSNKNHNKPTYDTLKANPIQNYKKLRELSLLNKEFIIHNNIYNNFNHKNKSFQKCSTNKIKVKIPFLNTEQENSPISRLVRKVCQKYIDFPFQILQYMVRNFPNIFST